MGFAGGERAMTRVRGTIREGMIVDLNGSFTRVTAEGRLSVQALAETISTLVEKGVGGHGADTLWDLRTAQLGEISGLEVRRLAAHVASSCGKCHGCRVAILVDDDAAFGVGRMWELLTEDDLPIESRVFRSLTAAEAWLATRVSVAALRRPLG